MIYIIREIIFFFANFRITHVIFQLRLEKLNGDTHSYNQHHTFI